MGLTEFRAARDAFLAGEISDAECEAAVIEWHGGTGRGTDQGEEQ